MDQWLWRWAIHNILNYWCGGQLFTLTRRYSNSSTTETEHGQFIYGLFTVLWKMNATLKFRRFTSKLHALNTHIPVCFCIQFKLKTRASPSDWPIELIPLYCFLLFAVWVGGQRGEPWMNHARLNVIIREMQKAKGNSKWLESVAVQSAKCYSGSDITWQMLLRCPETVGQEVRRGCEWSAYGEE